MKNIIVDNFLVNIFSSLGEEYFQLKIENFKQF